MKKGDMSPWAFFVMTIAYLVFLFYWGQFWANYVTVGG